MNQYDPSTAAGMAYDEIREGQRQRLRGLCPSDATNCSPSSLTPETDEAWKAVSRTPDGMYDSRVPISSFAYAMSRHSKKMELERNAAYAKIRDCVTRLDVCADGYAETREAIADLAAILSENAGVLARPGQDSTNTKNGL